MISFNELIITRKLPIGKLLKFPSLTGSVGGEVWVKFLFMEKAPPDQLY